MIRKSMVLCALLFTAVSGSIHAQKIEGKYEFKQSVMMAPDSPPTDVTATLTLTVKGDSATGTWQMNIPGRETAAIPLRGVVKGNKVTLTSGIQQGKMSGSDGSNEHTLEVTQEYVLTINDDEITGDINYNSPDNSVEIPSRSVKGKRVAA